MLGLQGLTEDDFWGFFIDALYIHEQWVERKNNSVATSIPGFLAHRYIWFEGLAWLRLARINGFTVPSAGILYCPDEVLEPFESAFQEDWPLVPYYYQGKFTAV